MDLSTNESTYYLQLFMMHDLKVRGLNLNVLMSSLPSAEIFTACSFKALFEKMVNNPQAQALQSSKPKLQAKHTISRDAHLVSADG